MLQYNYSKYELECGTDEAGRGCLAGPVTAAAIILSPLTSNGGNSTVEEIQFVSKYLNDSKKTTENLRRTLKPIIEKWAVSFSVTHLEPKIIDEINILNASMKAMQESIIKLNPIPNYIIVDGNSPLTPNNEIKNKGGRLFTDSEMELLLSIPNTSIIKGDSKYMSIAAASILAKTYRDDYMNKIHEEYPLYNWKQNKGYPTLEHREAIRKYGPTKYHRLSFRLLPDQLILNYELRPLANET